MLDQASPGILTTLYLWYIGICPNPEKSSTIPLIAMVQCGIPLDFPPEVENEAARAEPVADPGGLAA